MIERIRERYGIATRSGGSVVATEGAEDHTVQLNVHDGITSKVLLLTSAEARRFASMLLVLAARSEGDVE